MAKVSAADSSPFHAGERAVQERLGVRERMDRGGRRMITDFMSESQRDFFGALPFLVMGSLDAAGRPWASVVSGEPGFVTAPTPRALIVGRAPLPGDPLAENLRPHAPLGVLGIELETRRRLRANGRVSWVSDRGFELRVEQAFGNCKQYIQARTRIPVAQKEEAEPSLAAGATLSERATRILARCDTSFLATASARAAEGGREGVDVSHRGGLPGFIRAETTGAGTRLTLPDFYGNFMFNSFGNIEVNPRAGLLACDFATGDLLTLTARARVVWEGPEIRAFAGAERLLELDVEAHRLLPAALGGAWSEPAYASELATDAGDPGAGP